MIYDCTIYCIDFTFVIYILAVVSVHGIPTRFRLSLPLEGFGSLSLGEAYRHVYRHPKRHQEERDVASQ